MPRVEDGVGAVRVRPRRAVGPRRHSVAVVPSREHRHRGPVLPPAPTPAATGRRTRWPAFATGCGGPDRRGCGCPSIPRRPYLSTQGVQIGVQLTCQVVVVLATIPTTMTVRTGLESGLIRQPRPVLGGPSAYACGHLAPSDLSALRNSMNHFHLSLARELGSLVKRVSTRAA